MVSTTGEHAAWYVLDAGLVPRAAAMPEAIVKVVERIGENCEPALCSVLFMAGAGGSLRAGRDREPGAVDALGAPGADARHLGRRAGYVWPGGGITTMVDVTTMPDASFGYVPTPAIVGPIEFTMRRDDYAALGGHMAEIRPVESLTAERVKLTEWRAENPWPLAPPRSAA